MNAIAGLTVTYISMNDWLRAWAEMYGDDTQPGGLD